MQTEHVWQEVAQGANSTLDVLTRSFVEQPEAIFANAIEAELFRLYGMVTRGEIDIQDRQTPFETGLSQKNLDYIFAFARSMREAIISADEHDPDVTITTGIPGINLPARVQRQIIIKSVSHEQIVPDGHTPQWERKLSYNRNTDTVTLELTAYSPDGTSQKIRIDHDQKVPGAVNEEVGIHFSFTGHSDVSVAITRNASKTAGIFWSSGSMKLPRIKLDQEGKGVFLSMKDGIKSDLGNPPA